MGKETPYAWRMLAYLWSLGFLAAISRFVSAYYQQEITVTLDVNRTFIGLTWSFNIALAAICSPIGGWLTDKYGPKKMMVLNASLGVLSMLTVLAFRSPAGFFIGLGVLSGLSGIGASTGYVLITRWFARHRAKALMIMTSANSLGLAVLTPVFVSNRDWLDWLTAFTFTLWIGIVSIPLTLLLIKDRAKETGRGDSADGTKAAVEPDSGVQAAEEQAQAGPKLESTRSPWAGGLELYGAFFRNPATVVVIIALFTCGFSMGTVEMHLMAIHQHAHVSSVMFTSSLSLLGLLELAGGMLFAFMLDRMSRTLALSMLYAIRVVAFVFLFAHIELSPILFSVIFGASYLGAIPGGMLVASESLGGRAVGLQVGTLLVFHQAGAIVASVAGGALFDWTNSYQLLIGLNIALSAISAIGYWSVHAGKQRKAALPHYEKAGA